MVTVLKYEAVAKRYAKDVIAGRVSVCKWVRLACLRQEVPSSPYPNWPNSLARLDQPGCR